MAILIKTRKICQKLEFMSGILQKDTTKTYLAKIGLSQWTIMPDFHAGNTIFAIIHSTIVSGTMSFNYAIVARPTFYLSSSVQYDFGSGTMSDPICLKI